MSVCHQHCENLKFRDIRYFEYHENVGKVQLNKQILADVFNNNDITQMIFKFKRASKIQDEIERNKRLVVRELNILFRWKIIPTDSRLNTKGTGYAWGWGEEGHGEENLLISWNGLSDLEVEELIEEKEFISPPQIVCYTSEYINLVMEYLRDHPINKRKDDLWTHEAHYVDQEWLGFWCLEKTHFGGQILVWELCYSEGGVSPFGHPGAGTGFDPTDIMWGGIIYTGNNQHTPICNFKEWVLKQNGKKPNSIIKKTEFNTYKQEHNFNSKKYDISNPWFEFIKKNMLVF